MGTNNPTLRHLLVPFLLDRFPLLERYLKPRHWEAFDFPT